MALFVVSEVKYLYQPIKVTLHEGKLEVLLVHWDLVCSFSPICVLFILVSFCR